MCVNQATGVVEVAPTAVLVENGRATWPNLSHHRISMDYTPYSWMLCWKIMENIKRNARCNNAPL